MKKKGFTLIELLAVIVILAIIALIATPLVLKYIEKSRQESKVDSAYSFVRNLETEIANFSIKHNGKKYNGQPNDKGYYEISNFDNPKIDTTVKGDNPDTIKVCLSSLGQVERAVFQYGKYYVSYDGKKGSISDEATYSSFSCSGNLSKIEVPEATKEINAIAFYNYGLIKNEQGIKYYSDEEKEKEALESENDIFNYGTSFNNSFEVPVSLFKEIIPTDGSSIPVGVTFLDGTTATINLEYIQEDDIWKYESVTDMPYYQHGYGWNIKFKANQDYHYFLVNSAVGTSPGMHSLTILGTTLYFDIDISNELMSGNLATGKTNAFYTDYTKLTRVIVNYEDNTQDVYNITLNDFNANGNLAVKNGNHVFKMFGNDYITIHYKNNNFEYKKDIYIDMPKVVTITFEENGLMTTYKISDNPMVMYGSPDY